MQKMKKIMHKILASVLTLALVFGTVAGTGALEVKAEDSEYPKTLTVKVVNTEQSSVPGVQLVLESESGSRYNKTFTDVTNSDGIATCTLSGDEVGNYELNLASDSGYTCTPISIELDDDDNWKSYFAYVDDEEYDGGEVILVVSKEEEKPIPEISNVIAPENPVVSQEGGTVTLTIEGENLEGDLYYQRTFIGADEFGEPMEYTTVDYTVKTIPINDSDTGKKTINITLPSIVNTMYSKATVWKIYVGSTEDSLNKFVKINIDGIEEMKIPKITGVAISDTSVSEEGGTVTVKVTGENLPDSIYYRRHFEYKNLGETVSGYFDVMGTKVNITGTDSEKTFEVQIPAKTEKPNYDLTGWIVAVSLKTSSGFMMSKAIPVVEEPEDVVTEETKNALNAALEEAAGLKAEDYTADSWKAYNDAIEAAKALSEDATETEYQAAIKAIEEAKAALEKVAVTTTPVTQTIKVSKVTVSGISKKIAAGKKVQLTANVAPANASDKAVTWTTSNKKYATVTAAGKVTVKKAGIGKTVKITATAKDGSGKKAVYKIKIMKNAVKKVKLTAKKTVKAGKKVTVKATVKTNGKKANKTLKWTSSNTKYATVNSKGKVTTKKAGKGKTVKITAKATDGSNKKATVKIKIK